MAETTEIKFEALTLLSIRPILRHLRHWWLSKSERHFLICAAVEHERAREAEDNEAYYHKRAVMARSAQYED